MMDEQALLRYSRHILLKEIGIEGQLAICQATVLVVGCGGLGATVISILAAAGVKQLILADNDRLELSNLQRQVAYSEADIGQPKVVLAAQVVRRLNKQVATQAIQQKLDQQALIQLMDQADVVVDCTDNYITRHAVNQAALKTKTPLVSGAASRFDGQLTVFDFRQPHSPCYACLFDPTMLSDDGRCATLGIFSPLVGMIGSQQAAETLKLIGQIGKSPIGQLIVYDALFAKMHIISFAKRFDCTVCANPLSIGLCTFLRVDWVKVTECNDKIERQDASFIQHLFERIAPRYDHFALLSDAIIKRMMHRLAYVRLQPDRVLDVGSGTGNGAFHLRQHYPVADVIELDIAWSMLTCSYCKTVNTSSRRSQWLLNANMDYLPIANEAVDMLWSNLVLHYTNHPERILQEWHRVLKPNGLLMFSLLGPKTLQEFQSVFLQSGCLGSPHHFASMQAIGDQLLEVGFSDPVVDHEMVVLTYPNWRMMIQALRGSGMYALLINQLPARLSQQQWRRIQQQYDMLRYGGADWPVTCEVIYGHAWRAIADDALYSIRSVGSVCGG